MSDKSGTRFCRQTHGKSKGQNLSGDSVIVRQTLVGIDGTEMPFRSKLDPADKSADKSGGGRRGGRSPVGRVFIVGAVALSKAGHPRRIRMAQIPDGSAKTLHGFIVRSAAPGAHAVSDGWPGSENPPANCHEARQSRSPSVTQSVSSRAARRMNACLGSTASSRTASGG